MALHFAQVFAEFQKSKDETVPLAFAYPTGSANPPFLMTRVATGIIPTTGDVALAQKQNVERCVLLAACAAAGAPDDPAKTQELLKAPEPKVSRAVFITAMASALFDASQLYTPAETGRSGKDQDPVHARAGSAEDGPGVEDQQGPERQDRKDAQAE